MGLGCEWRHAWKWWAGNFGDFWKSSELRFVSGQGQSSWGLRDVPCVRWVSELRFWLWAESSAGELTEGQCRNSQHSKNCVSLSSCQKTKSQKKLINVSYLNKRKSSVFHGIPMQNEHFTYPYICIVVSWLYYRCTWHILQLQPLGQCHSWYENVSCVILWC